MPEQKPQEPDLAQQGQQPQEPEAPRQAEPNPQKQNPVKPELAPIELFKEHQDIDAKQDD